MDKKYLIRALILPLLCGAAICLALAQRWSDPWGSLLINLAAAFIGSIVTVSYVDTVLRRVERTRWANVRARTTNQLQRVAVAAISSIRSALRIRARGFLDLDLGSSGYVSILLREQLRLAEAVLPGLVNDLERVNNADWPTLVQNLQGAVQAIDRALALFGRDLAPYVTELLLDIQSAAEGIWASYRTFQDPIGVSAEDLPKEA